MNHITLAWTVFKFGERSQSYTFLNCWLFLFLYRNCRKWPRWKQQFKHTHRINYSNKQSMFQKKKNVIVVYCTCRVSIICGTFYLRRWHQVACMVRQRLYSLRRHLQFRLQFGVRFIVALGVCLEVRDVALLYSMVLHFLSLLHFSCYIY